MYIICSVVENCCQAPSINDTSTMWRFLIKVPYLGKLSVMYNTENVGLSYFSSDENKGQSIVVICSLKVNCNGKMTWAYILA